MRAIRLLLFGVATGCGGSTDSAGSACTPGASVACVGPGGCAGGQVCAVDGKSLGSCDCAARPDAGGDAVLADTNAADSASVDIGIPDTAPLDSASGTITPGTIADTVVWLVGDLGVTAFPSGATAKSWADQSKAGNNATGGAVAADTGPKIVKGAVNGHDALEFGATTWFRIADSASVQFGTTPFCILAVVGKSAGDAGVWNHIFAKDSQVQFSFAIADKLHFFSPSMLSSADYPAGPGFHVVGVRGPFIELRVDGKPVAGKMLATSISFAGRAVQIGGSGQNRTFQLAELAAIKGSVTDAQIQGVEVYLLLTTI